MAIKIPATLLQNYQKEYENTDITIEELCKKYDITIKQLRGYTKWQKQQPDVAIVTTSNTSIEEDLGILSDIEEFKKLAIKHAVNFIKEDIRFAEIKEFKDMVAIVDSIEKSYKDTKDSRPTINIAIQNLIERFKDDI